MAIKMQVVKNGTNYDISKLLGSVTWSGDLKTCSRKLEFELLKGKHIDNFDIDLSKDLIIFTDHEGHEIFRGFAYSRDKESASNTVKYVAFDYAEKLNKIKVSYNFQDKTPQSIMRTILKDYGFKEGINVAGDSQKVSKIFIGATAYEAIMTAYTLQSNINKKPYMVYCEKDTICSRVQGQATLKLSFEEYKNIINSSFSESVENMVNQVVIVDDKGNKKSVVKDDNLLKIHGLFQDIYKAEEGKDATLEAKNMLQGIESKMSIEGFGDTSCKSGFGVSVVDNSTGLVGKFYIEADSHEWQGNNYKVKLDLSLKNIMNKVEAGESEENENSSSTGSSSNYSNGGNSSLVSTAKKYLGVPYVWGGTSPKGFDCSGFTQYVFKQHGISIPRTSSQQSQSGKSVSKNNLQQGDLVFFNTSGSGVSHVGIYIGNGEMIHAPKPSDVVKIVSINSSYYTSRYVSARRY